MSDRNLLNKIRIQDNAAVGDLHRRPSIKVSEDQLMSRNFELLHE